MRILICIFLFICGSLISQQQKNFSLEIQGNTFSGLGNNFISEGVKTFTGFGAVFSRTFFKNAGLSVEFHQATGEVKDVSVFGILKNPQITSIEMVGLYRIHVSPKFDVEGNIGYGNMVIKSESVYRDEGFRENGGALIIGGKALYSISKNNSFYLVGSPRFYFLTTDTEITNQNAEKFYSKATLFNLSLGLRLYF